MGLICNEVDLIFLQVQEIWNSIYRDAQSDEAISNLFFKIGHKLDINQFDTFYRNVSRIKE